MARGPGHRHRIEPLGLGDRLAHACTIERIVGIGRVVDSLDPRCPHHRREFLAPPAEQRPHQHHFRDDAFGKEDRPGPHPCEPRQPASPVEAHQQGFGLIVGMMRGGENRRADLLEMATERLVARSARVGLQVAGSDLHPQRSMRNAQPFAHPGDKRRFVRAFGAQAVIDRRRPHPPRHRRIGEQQQRKTVRSARYGDPQRNPCEIGIVGPDLCEVGPEPLDQRRVGRPACQEQLTLRRLAWY